MFKPTNPISDAIMAVQMDPTGAAKALIKRNLIENTRKAIRIKAEESPQTPWTPEIVVSRMHEDTDAEVFTLFALVGIDDNKLLELAHESLEKIERKKRGYLPQSTGERIKCFFNKVTKKWERQ